jgi:DNA-binding HxlR family transcriptional regulator
MPGIRNPTRPAQPVLRPGEIFDPVARALEVIGDRWTLVLVRHLLGSPRGFQQLRVRTGIAPRVLSTRLRQLVSAGFIRTVAEGARQVYALTELGHSLEPIIASIGHWWIQRGLEELGIDTNRFTETSAQSVLESLPFMVHAEHAQGVDLIFEIRLEGPGGGVWTVRINDGHCSVETGFADHADVRYTADADIWCGVALGILDARDVYKRGLMTKEGSREAMDFYFHQLSGTPVEDLPRRDPELPGAPLPESRERSKT